MVFQLDRHLAAIDTAIVKRLAVDEGLARRTEILTSIPGVSRVTAAGLLTQMPERGRLDAKAVASLAGLAPPSLGNLAPGRAAAASRVVGRERDGFSTCRHWRRSVPTRTCARRIASSSRRESLGRLRWSPSCASSSCWPTYYSNRTAAGSPTGTGGTACRSSRSDRCLRGGRAWLREGL